MKTRSILTVRELVNYLKNVNPEAKVYLAPSSYEPEELQEFIDYKKKKKCVAIEMECPVKKTKYVMLGYAE